MISTLHNLETFDGFRKEHRKIRNPTTDVEKIKER